MDNLNAANYTGAGPACRGLFIGVQPVRSKNRRGRISRGDPMRAIPASPSLFALVWGGPGSPAGMAGCWSPATAPGQAQETVSGRCSGAASPCYLLWCAWASLLQIGIVGARAALGRRPDDILAGILDVAGFAVNAVGGVDLQPWPGIPIRISNTPPGSSAGRVRPRWAG